MNMTLTDKQRSMLNEIKKIKASGREVSYTELAKRMFMSPVTARATCLSLQNKGYIRIEFKEIGKTGKIGRSKIVVLEKSLAYDVVKSFIERKGGK